MRKFNVETTIAAFELEQLVGDWCRELDTNSGLNAAEFFTENCVVNTSRVSYEGCAAMKQFYQGRLDPVRAEQKHGMRTARHMFTNLRIAIEQKDRATVSFLITNFSGPGKAPLSPLLPAQIGRGM